MGCGKNGGFDKHPDWQQWAIFAIHDKPIEAMNQSAERMITGLYGSFIDRWIKKFKCETWTLFLQPIEGHGKWDGKQPFGELAKQTAYDGPVAILTRATIRLSRLKAFWQNVNGVAMEMANAGGLVTSFGIGEMPFIKQATFSIWQSREAMKQFAYKRQHHTDVIQKTRRENWYREEMFVRFIPLQAFGTIKGSDPLGGKL